MSSYIDAAKEAIMKLTESEKFIFRGTSKMTRLFGIYSSFLRVDGEGYGLECFVRERENCVVMKLSMPFEYEDEQRKLLRGYLKCVNQSKKMKSEFSLDIFNSVVLIRCIGYKERALTAEDLRKVLAEMTVEAELFLPVTKAIAKGRPVPAKAEESSWLYLFLVRVFSIDELPCTADEPSRMFFEDFKAMQETGGSGDPIGKDEEEQENVIEIGDDNLGFCSTLQERKKPSRFEDPEFLEKFDRIMNSEIDWLG